MKLLTKEGVVRIRKADGRTPPWDARDAVAFWRAADYNGSGPLLDLTGRGHDLRLGSIEGADTNDPLFLPFNGEKYVYLPGVDNNYLSTPHNAEFVVTSDIDVRMKLHPAFWSGGSNNQRLISHLGTNTGWSLDISTTGALIFWVGDGTSYGSIQSTVGVPFSSNDHGWIRATWRASDGRVQFFTSTDGANWEQLGANVSLVKTLSGGTTSLLIGPVGGALKPISKFYNAEVRNGIDGPVVASFNAEDMGQTGGTSGSRVWTINRATTGRKSVLVDRPVFLFGTDDYMEAASHPDFDVIGDATWVVSSRYHGTPGAAEMLLVRRAGTSGTQDQFGIWYASTNMVGRHNAGAAEQFTNLARPVVLNEIATTSLRRQGSQLTVNTGVDQLSSTVVPEDLTPGTPLRVGVDSHSLINFGNFEFFGAAIFRRALTDAQIAEVGSSLMRSSISPPIPLSMLLAENGDILATENNEILLLED